MNARKLQLLQDEAWQEIAGDIHTRAAYNRWKLAAGGRPSKAAVGDMFRHQTTVLQHIGKLHDAIVKSWAPTGSVTSRQMNSCVSVLHTKSVTVRSIITLKGNEQETSFQDKRCSLWMPPLLIDREEENSHIYCGRMQSNSRPLQSGDQ